MIICLTPAALRFIPALRGFALPALMRTGSNCWEGAGASGCFGYSGTTGICLQISIFPVIVLCSLYNFVFAFQQQQYEQRYVFDFWDFFGNCL